MGELAGMFLAVFLAELGDKTQLATLLFASEGKAAPWQVFLVSAGALVLSSALAVGLGALAGRYLTALPLKPLAGAAFILIGAMTLIQYFRG